MDIKNKCKKKNHKQEIKKPIKKKKLRNYWTWRGCNLKFTILSLHIH
jgi:hypothetical protein